MPRNINFERLSLQDALDLAIMIEEEAAERYEELAAQMEVHHTPEAAQFFHFMVKNETKHGEELTERRKQLFGDAPRNVDSSMVWEVEAPEYEKVRVFMTAQDALAVALQSEEKAYRFFESAVKYVKDADVLKLFEELKQEEIEHQQLVKKELSKLPEDSKVDVSDYADEPVAQ